MEVPTGFLATFWSFISFLPFFFILLILGLIKAAIIGPIVVLIVFIGSSAVIIGLWPVHLMWTYYCVLKTKIFGLALKVLLLLFLPVPLLAWPIVGILGSLLVGVGYGFVSPLVATFEAVGEQVIDKLFHCFSDGCRSSLEGACTIVQDLTDFCFHSYFSYMDELMQEVPEDEKPWDIKLSKLPSCLLVCLLAVPIDMIMITLVALWKSPCMLIRGWQRLLQDLIGREGPFLETVCVPFAGLAIILWPIAVVGAVVCAFICSCFLALYGGVVVYQENSLRMGLSYIVSVISMFDEYTNDLLYLREGSCLPRPEYRKDKAQDVTERKKHNEQDKNEFKDAKLGATSTKLASERSRTLKKVFQQLKPIQIWDWLFRSCEQNGRNLLRDGLITVIDIADCILKGKSKKLSIKLPAWCILQCLLRSAKSDSYGLLISDEVELTKFNWPKDKVLEWLLGPLLVMKEQIKGLHLDENEEACLRKLIMTYICESPEDWNGSGFPLNDRVRIAQLQAICRRLQGIVGSMSRIPTFRRRFRNLIKELYMEAVKTGALNQDGDSSISISKISKSIDSDGKREMDAVEITVENGADDNLDIV